MVAGLTRTGGQAIRPAEPGDLDALLRLEDEAFETDRLDRRAFRHAVGSPTILALVAESGGGDLDGYALVQVRRGSTVGRLTSLAVARGAAGRGLGRNLLSAAEVAATRAGCNRMRLEVRHDNGHARRLYDGAGYGLIGTVPDYYEDGAAACRYERALDARRPGAGGTDSR